MFLQTIAKEAGVVSFAYVVAFFVTFELLMPVQALFFPEFPSRASLLFLPHGVRVLSAWLLGWRSILALLPGVFLVFLYVAGTGVFVPSRLAAIAIAVSVPTVIFFVLRLSGWDLHPQVGKNPRWVWIMIAGLIISVVTSFLTNWVFGSSLEDYFAYLIGDFFGLFFLLLLLLLGLRHLERVRAP